MFFDFSSAFNTMRPALLRTKLLDMQVDAPLVAWITHHLPHRLATVHEAAEQRLCHGGLYQQGDGSLSTGVLWKAMDPSQTSQHQED